MATPVWTAGADDNISEGLTPPTPPPPLPPRMLEDNLDEASTPSPPPLPERRYLIDEQEDDLQRVSGYTLIKNDTNSDPPPVPKRTPLSEQLIHTPSSDPPPVPDCTPKYVTSEAGTQHPLLYNSDMAYAERVIDPKLKNLSRPLPLEPKGEVHSKHPEPEYDVAMPTHLRLPPSSTAVVVKQPEPEYDVAMPPPRPSTAIAAAQPLYDEAVLPPPQERPRAVSPIGDKELPRYVSHPTSSQIAVHVQPYEVVPLHRTRTQPSGGHARAERHESSFHPGRLPIEAVDVPSGHSATSRVNEAYDSAIPPPLPPIGPRKWQAGQDDSSIPNSNQYSTLEHEQFKHLQRLNVTLPRQAADPNQSMYSQLKLSEVKTLQNVGASRPTGNSISDRRNTAPLPVRFVRRPHVYEEVQENENSTHDSNGPFLVLEHTDSFDNSDSGRSETVAAGVDAQIPAGITEQDLERRMKRMEGHSYAEMDFLSWPKLPADLCPQNTQASEINTALRNSLFTSDYASDNLPPGWVREVNEQGLVFYWHKPTGAIKYSLPTVTDSVSLTHKSMSPPPPPDHSHASAVKPSVSQKPRPSTFGASYLGSVRVEEQSLVRGKSVVVVYESISAINSGTAEIQLLAGKEKGDIVYLQVQDMTLRWLEPETSSVIVSQPVNRIRVWGIGQENERDFGYVARNPTTHQHQCNVFRCDIAAKGVARALLETHKQNKKKSLRGKGGGGDEGGKDDQRAKPTQLAIARAQEKDQSGSPDPVQESNSEGTVLVSVPLQSEERERSLSNARTFTGEDNESYKRLEAVYCGSVDVSSPHGMPVINEGVAQLSSAQEGWTDVFVDIASSHIKILDRNNEQLLKEHRVRFLSFLGIASDDRYCGYITDNGDNMFQLHGFRCYPNADKLCLLLHSACQSRYQRVLDAHVEADVPAPPEVQPVPFLSRIGSLKRSKKKKSSSSSELDDENFTLQFNGFEPTTSPSGVEAVRPAVQKLNDSLSTVEFVVNSTGFIITDPQKKYFARKQFTFKKITYCCRIKNHFTFIAKDGGKLLCYVFTESGDCISEVVSTVQKFLS